MNPHQQCQDIKIKYRNEPIITDKPHCLETVTRIKGILDMKKIGFSNYF